MPTLSLRPSAGTLEGPNASSPGSGYNDSSISSPSSEELPEALKRARRRIWLQRNPQYFGSDLEAAEPQLYNMYIRRFQSAEEREAEGRAKGHERYANFLMSNVVCPRNRTGTDSSRRPIDAPNRAPQPNKLIPLELEREDPPASKVEARERWQTLMEYRFVDGLDLDFPYQAVDEDAENDDIEEQSRKLEDAYFSQEAAAFEVAEDQLNGQTGVQDY